MSKLFDVTTDSLGASINLRELRNNVVSANIANAETPGYKARKLDFEEALKRAIEIQPLKEKANPDSYALGPGRFSQIRADIYENPDINLTNDGNTVDMEKEMASLAENSIIYKAAVQLINKKLAGMRYAVTEGSR